MPAGHGFARPQPGVPAFVPPACAPGTRRPEGRRLQTTSRGSVSPRRPGAGRRRRARTARSPCRCGISGGPRGVCPATSAGRRIPRRRGRTWSRRPSGVRAPRNASRAAWTRPLRRGDPAGSPPRRPCGNGATGRSGSRRSARRGRSGRSGGGAWTGRCGNHWSTEVPFLSSARVPSQGCGARSGRVLPVGLRRDRRLRAAPPVAAVRALVRHEGTVCERTSRGGPMA